MHSVIIIGGGLAGLTTAYLLRQRGINASILEADNRLGGRIYTKEKEGLKYELGATWVFQDHQLKQLLHELRLELYPQHLSGDALIKYGPSIPVQKSATEALMNGAMYHKIKGGTSSIIHALADKLDPSSIHLNKKVTEINFHEGPVTLKTADDSLYNASNVVITVPPKVIAQQIRLTPEAGLSDIMNTTHTWMGESSKFTIFTDQDYWRNRNLSGFVFSNYDLIREMQDHSSGSSFGFTGFLQPTAEQMYSFTDRKECAEREIASLMGIPEEHILGYEDFLWGIYFSDKEHGNYNTHHMPHQNNGHSFYEQAHYNRRMFFAGAETSPVNPGYMEGAVLSAYRAVELMMHGYKGLDS